MHGGRGGTLLLPANVDSSARNPTRAESGGGDDEARPFGSGVASAAAAEASWAQGAAAAGRGGRGRGRGRAARGQGTPSPTRPPRRAPCTPSRTTACGSAHSGCPRGFRSDLEAGIEKVIYACRFMAFLAIAGSLAGSVLCFLKGCTFVMDAFVEYYLRGDGKVVLMLIEAIDMYLIGTVMFVFGRACTSCSSERPKWLEIRSVSDLKTKLGHVIVLVLLVGISEKSKRVTITSCTDLFCFAGSIFLSSATTSYFSHRQLIDTMAISSKIAVVFMLLLSTTFMQLPVPADARRLEVKAPILSVHRPCTGRSTLETPPEQVESTTPGHSPSIGHNSPPN
ncbi:hypothetical protein ZWY2020_001924 [Hordeum vulgare]|nr:hypothetical protein ZWY2020_001924 [Hordeum vulgare]